LPRNKKIKPSDRKNELLNVRWRAKRVLIFKKGAIIGVPDNQGIKRGEATKHSLLPLGLLT